MNKNNKNLIVIILVMLVSITCISCGNESETISLSTGSDKGTTLPEEIATQAKGGIFVYVSGYVRNPGVLEVNPGTRLFQVIELAGGFTEKAKKDYLNMASEVMDGQRVDVLSEKQYKKLLATEDKSDNQSDSSMESGTNLININTASKDELMTLPGIGESKAVAIISYREQNGSFKKPEDIMNVSGIKDASYQKFAAMITT